METTKQYVQRVLDPWYEMKCRDVGKEYGKQTLMFIVDCWATHLSRDFRGWLKRNFPYVRLMFVPPNMTSVCQPADTGLQKPLKDQVKGGYQRWLISQLEASPDQEKCSLGFTAVKGPSLQWLFNSWLSLKCDREKVLNAWRDAGLGVLADEAYRKEVRDAALSVDSKILQLPEFEPEREVNLEIAIDEDDLDPEDAGADPAEDPGEDQGAEAAPDGTASDDMVDEDEEQRAMLRMARQAINDQLDMISARSAPRRPQQRRVRRRGRGVQFEPLSEESQNAPPPVIPQSPGMAADNIN